MADVKCLKDGKFAVTNNPSLPQVTFKKDDELKGIPKNFAARLVELGFAEVSEDVEKKTIIPRVKKKADRKRA